MKHIKNKIVTRKKPKLSPAEQTILDASIPSLLNEFKKVQKKESKFSKHLRDVVVLRVQFLIREGFIHSEDELLLCSHPFYDFKQCELRAERECHVCRFMNPEFKL